MPAQRAAAMQSSFSNLEYAAKKKLTRRDRFLAEIDAVTPWAALAAVLDLFTPRVRGRGRPPIGLESMLRMYKWGDATARTKKLNMVNLAEPPSS